MDEQIKTILIIIALALGVNAIASASNNGVSDKEKVQTQSGRKYIVEAKTDGLYENLSMDVYIRGNASYNIIYVVYYYDNKSKKYIEVESESMPGFKTRHYVIVDEMEYYFTF